MALVVLASACGQSSSNDASSNNGASSAGASSGGSASVSTCEPTIESLSTDVFAKSCVAATCHNAADAAGALDLESPGVESRLIGAEAGTCGGWVRVVPGSPEDSFVWHKLYETEPPCGASMPLVGHLTAVELDCIREWIRNASPVEAGPGCETCGTADCVDLTTDTAHCGDCGVACPAGSACIDGTCSCSGSLEFCGSSCVDTQSSLGHCGGCDMPCGAGAVCNVGHCLCAGGLTSCGSECVDFQSDPAHCGDCATACAAGEVCLRSVCSAGCDTLTQCGSACVDTTTSTLNCGNCGVACPSGASCISGVCECPDGTSNCGGQCINTISDPSNCGGCGVACGGGLVCESGACQCAGGGTACGNSCVDTTSDSNNCGGCGVVCGVGQTCVSGACTCSGNSTVSFSADIQPIFTANCTSAGCHAGIRPAEGMSLEAGKAYQSIVGVASSQCSSRKRVAPGDPGASYLVNKLMGVNLCFGSQMPKAGASIPQGDLAKIGSWICGGALND